MAFGDADLGTFLTDFAVPVQSGAVTTNGILRIYDQGNPQPDADNSALGRFVEVLVKTGALPGLVLESVVAVNGLLYYVNSFDRVNDGAFTKLYAQLIDGQPILGSMRNTLAGIAQALVGSTLAFTNIAFVGDSITLGTHATVPATGGFVGLVQAALPGATITNLGVSGARAGDAVTTYPAWLATHTPDLTVFGFGVNEALQSISVATYIANMTTLINQAKTANSEFAIFIEPAQNAADLSPYVEAARALAVSYGAVFVVDIFARWGTYAAGLASGFQYGDGIHPSDAGHADIAIPMKAAINAALKSTPVAAYGVPVAPVGWWKEDSLTYGNGATVRYWGDSSRQGAILSLGVGSAPTFSTSLFGGGAVSFPAGSPLQNTAFTGLNAVTALTVFIVYRTANAPASNAIIFCPSNQAGEVQEFSSTVFNVLTSGNNGKSATVDTSKHVHEVVFDGSQTGNAGRLTVWREGTAQTLVFTGTIPAVTGSSAGVGIGDIAGGAAPFAGDVAEVLVYAAALSGAQRSTIRVALGAKYSITVTP